MSEMITFTFLREIQKKERTSSELSKLDPGFYEAVKEYILRKKRIRERGKELSFKEKKEIENIGPVVKSIYDTRERKIVNGALLAARTGMKMANILVHEEKLLADICKRIEESRAGFEYVLGSKPEYVPVGDKAGDKEPVDDMVRIKVIEDIPEFVGEDLKAYGPWKAGETVMCNRDFSVVFIKGGKAEEVR
ncbi:MAG: hypothetical protein ABIG84_02435 [archaeon]